MQKKKMNSGRKITIRPKGTSSSKKKLHEIFLCPFIVYDLSKGMKLETVWSLLENNCPRNDINSNKCINMTRTCLASFD